MKKEKHKKNLAMIYFVIIIYLELLFHLLTKGFDGLIGWKIIYLLFFVSIVSIIFSFVSKIGQNEKVNRIITCVLTFFLSVFYFAHFMFKSLFNTYFSIHLFGISDQAITFMDEVILEVLKRLPLLLLFIIPFVFILVYKKHISYKLTKRVVKRDVTSLVIGIVLFIVSVLINKDIKILYYNVDNNAMNIEKMGVSVSTYLDFKRIVFPVKEEILTNNLNMDTIDNNKEIVYEPNKMDIDFASLTNSTNNSTLKSMHKFFNNQNPTYKNEYSGIYKDKNLVVVMGESLNTIAISEKYTPTLYKMSHDGFEFTNFYTPINLSTIGGEFQNLTGLFANLSILSNQFRKGNNYYPFGLGNMFKKDDYKVQAYHPNSGYFQDRNRYLANMGFDKFVARYMGLDEKMNCNLWPQSDDDMVKATVDDFIDSDKFMTYYVSVSGHMPWSWAENNMSRRNKEALEGSGYSEEAAAYIAANMELDKAMQSLMEKLEEEDKLKDTVFVIIPDHYPYSMNIKTINELSDYERDSKFEVNHSTLIIYNSEQEHKVIDKITTQLDVLPTIYNLFGMEYDSRLIMGKDIFSTTDGLVYFNDRSWITNKGRYNASNGRFTPNEGVEVADDYVTNVNNVVASRINMSKLIMEQDYYRKVVK